MFLRLFLLSIVYTNLKVCFNVELKNTSNVSTTCFEELGCLETTEEWFHHKYRPKNVDPLDRHTIRTEFNLITRSLDGTKSLQYDMVNAKKDFTISGYNKDKGVIMLIHDFTGNGRTGWIKHIVSTLSTKLNIISVDWEAGAEPPFLQAVANARVVALEIQSVLKVLQEITSHKHPIHIIGHGVGAHIAGYVGKSVNVTKITALDPTGPYFENMPSVVRLNPTDAIFVEVLHTDAFNKRSQGTRHRMGHIDFYFNGASLQPECNQTTQYPVFTKLDRNALKEGTILPACSHKRAFKYYIEALQSDNCEFTGIECGSYKEFIEGKCSSCGNHSSIKCATFGSGVTNLIYPKDNLYINTRGEPPYCLNTYSVTIHMQNHTNARKVQEGSFDVIMINNHGSMMNATSSLRNDSRRKSSVYKFTAGEARSLLFYASEPRFLNITEARLKWTHHKSVSCVFCHTFVYVEKLTIKLLTVKEICDLNENVLCPEIGKTKIENGNYVIYKTCQEMGAVNSTNSQP